MRDMDRRERDALDRHITGNWGEDQFRTDPPTRADGARCGDCGAALDKGEVDVCTACLGPDPCELCDWVDGHEEECPNGTITADGSSATSRVESR